MVIKSPEGISLFFSHNKPLMLPWPPDPRGPTRRPWLNAVENKRPTWIARWGPSLRGMDQDVFGTWRILRLFELLLDQYIYWILLILYIYSIYIIILVTIVIMMILLFFDVNYRSLVCFYNWEIMGFMRTFCWRIFRVSRPFCMSHRRSGGRCYFWVTKGTGKKEETTGIYRCFDGPWEFKHVGKGMKSIKQSRTHEWVKNNFLFACKMSLLGQNTSMN